MAKGYEKSQQRLALLSALGRSLARRSGSRCELCSVAGAALQPWEVPPGPEEPELDRCLFLCADCRQQLERPAAIDAKRWRCAADSLWSEVPAAQVVAARVLRRLASTELWAREALESADFDEETQTWIDQRPL